MATLSIARRYARALLDVTSEAGSSDAALDQLTTLAKTFAQSEELRDLAANPAYTREQRMAVMEGLLPALGVTDPSLVNLIRLLVDRRRLVNLQDITRVYRDMVDARLGRVRGKVTSARPLPADILEKLQQNLKRMTQREVLLETGLDPSLIGGVSTQVGSLVFDGSLRNQLEELRLQLIRS